MNNGGRHVFLGARTRLGALCLAASCAALPVRAADVVFIDFESLLQGAPVGSPFAGIAFANAIVLTAGATLNEFEFPPHSGFQLAGDEGAPMRISFDLPVSDFSAFFTYAVPLTLTAYDAGGNLVGSATSRFASNLALSGDPGSVSNERIELTHASGYSSLVIVGAAAGTSFTIDDITLSSPIPEPQSVVLLLAGLAWVAARRPGASPARWRA